MNALFDKLSPYFNLASRVLLAAIFIWAGYGKIGGYSWYLENMITPMGLPSIVLPLTIALELGGGILLLIGFQARLVSFLLAGFTLVAAFIYHLQPQDVMQMIMFMKNLAIAGGLLLITQYGAGAFSLDKRK
ncbi:DoxX family protein [Permianibacter sp. IMCC34836]|uniref:DoxX family protein n=1 Tax=Permianibacter fluminis TaxID=2738515 RepID=UPI0015563063|nr:DoxX family protein [Permianibacter fluminis]NQD38654.1 DoxX family protein [Permianibacter fluminis]